MRYGILSDIHGNIDALEAVVAALEDVAVDGWLCLGDLVGYGAEPRAVVDRVRELDTLVVRGNHDHAVGDPALDASFNVWAARAIAWTRERLDDGASDYLSRLPLTHVLDDVLMVHAAPSDPIGWPYILDMATADRELDEFQQALCLFGHTHAPLSYSDAKGAGTVEAGTVAPYGDGLRAIVNVGSVGQPRDGDPAAAAGVLDTTEHTVSFMRVAYDVERAAGRIRDAGLPPLLADRLFQGR
ncbi:MAG: metallophosphoesterase [Candidatus Eisenbacteria bacterium]|nr:metallophosphoesterase [Candidatus Eisenbacteria bacterium]